MSDSVEWIVDTEATLEEAPALAQRVLAWLVEQHIVQARPAPDQTALGGAPLHLPADGAEPWSIQVMGTLGCGLQIATERTVFHTGDNGLDALQCPQCKTVHPRETVAWSEAVNGWFIGEDDRLACPTCETAASVTNWVFAVEDRDGWSFEFDWGFGQLAFGFSNWVIRPELVSEIGHLLGHRVKLVHEHI